MQCPACGYIKNTNSHKCDNCGLIYSKYSPPFNNSEPDRTISFAKRLFKFSLKIFVFLLFFMSVWIYTNLKRNHSFFQRALIYNNKTSNNIVVAPLGSDMEGLNYVYVSGKVSLKMNKSGEIPVKKAIISFENLDGDEKREIMSQLDGFYEISLKQGIYFLKIFIPEQKVTLTERLDLRNVAELKNKNFVIN